MLCLVFFQMNHDKSEFEIKPNNYLPVLWLIVNCKLTGVRLGVIVGG